MRQLSEAGCEKLFTEQVSSVAVRDQFGVPVIARERPDLSAGSSTAIAQKGLRNDAVTLITGSNGAQAGLAQFGIDNVAAAVIVDSPGSVIAQLQVGRGNSTTAGIFGGTSNAISTLQFGNNL